MSTKSDNRPDPLNSTALALVWKDRGASLELPETLPETITPQTVPEIDGDEDEYVPPSVIMMAGMMRGIINLRYAKRAGYVETHAFEADDGSYGFGFWPTGLLEEAMKEQSAGSEPIDVYTDPDFHEYVQDFLTDFSEFCDGKNVEIHFDTVGVTALSKMDMFKALSEYISSPEYALSTPDSAYLPDNIFDPEIARQQRHHRQRLHADAVRPHLDRQPRVRELGQFGPDPLFTVNNSPFSSMREFEQACYVATTVDMPFSLNHVYTTICQEDMLDPQDYDHIVRGNQPTMGGYN